MALGTHALSRPTFSAILEKTNLGLLGRVVAFGSSGLENTNFKWKMHQNYTKNTKNTCHLKDIPKACPKEDG